MTLTTLEAAARLGTCRRTLLDWCNRLGLPHHTGRVSERGGRPMVLIDERDLKEWAAQHLVKNHKGRWVVNKAAIQAKRKVQPGLYRNPRDIPLEELCGKYEPNPAFVAVRVMRIRGYAAMVDQGMPLFAGA